MVLPAVRAVVYGESPSVMSPLYPAFSFVLRRASKPAQIRPKSPGGAGTLLSPKPVSYTHLDVYKRQVLVSLYPPVLLEIVVEFLDLDRSELVQRNVPNSGNDVVLDIIGVVRFGVCLLYTSRCV